MPGDINGTIISLILIVSGFPITIVRVNLWGTVRNDKLLKKSHKHIQEITRDGLRIFELTGMPVKYKQKIVNSANRIVNCTQI